MTRLLAFIWAFLFALAAFAQTPNPYSPFPTLTLGQIQPTDTIPVTGQRFTNQLYLTLPLIQSWLAANGGSGQVSPISYGAKCDGATVDTAAFNAAIAASGSIVLPPESNCVVGNLVITDRQTLDCGNSVLTAAPGSTWIVKKTGFASFIRNCIIYDPTLLETQTSTLTAPATPGTSVLNVSSAASYQVNMLASIQLASGAYWTSRIVGVNTTANTITIADQIPWTVTGLSVANGGTGWGNGREGIMLLGTGAPATATLAVSGGVVTGLTLDAPGLYQSNPGTPVSFYDPGLPGANSLSVNATYAGALTGAYVDAAFGAVIDDVANGGGIENVTVSRAPVGLQVLASSGSTTQEHIKAFDVNNATIAGVAKFSGVNSSDFNGMTLDGYTHHASAYGGVGLFIEGTSRVAANGGNTFNFSALGFETGLFDVNGQLDTFLHAKPDTNRNYGALCIGCQYTNFPYLWAAFTGPNALPSLGSIAGKGIGAYFGTSPAGNAALYNSIADFETSTNASDVHFGDPAGYLRIGQVWGPSKLMTAVNSSSVSLYSVAGIVTLNPYPIGGLTSPQYVGPNGIQPFQSLVTGQVAGITGIVSGFNAHVGIAPGADTYSIFLYSNAWNGTAYTGWTTIAGCTVTGTATGCTSRNSGASVGPQDMLDFSISSSAATFIANQNISAQVLGQ